MYQFFFTLSCPDSICPTISKPLLSCFSEKALLEHCLIVWGSWPAWHIGSTNCVGLGRDYLSCQPLIFFPLKPNYFFHIKVVERFIFIDHTTPNVDVLNLHWIVVVFSSFAFFQVNCLYLRMSARGEEGLFDVVFHFLIVLIVFMWHSHPISPLVSTCARSEQKPYKWSFKWFSFPFLQDHDYP